MRVYPIAGLLIRDPVKRDFLPAAGRNVPDGDPYWLRRIADGDASTKAPPATTAAKTSTSAPKNADAKAE